MGEEITGISEIKEHESNMFAYHHSRPLPYVQYDIVSQARTSEEPYKSAFLWLEKELGYYPLFLAVGNTEDDIRVTGYPEQWRRLLSSGIQNEYRQKGQIDNEVLFSFPDIPNGVFLNYGYWWDTILNSEDNNQEVNKWVKKLLFRPTWDKERWLGSGHRHVDLRRGVRHHGRGDRQCCTRSEWRHHRSDRHPVERAGSPDRLCADRGGAVRPPARTRACPPGRHR